MFGQLNNLAQGQRAGKQQDLDSYKDFFFHSLTNVLNQSNKLRSP